MAWVIKSLLADYTGTVDAAWLKPAVTVAEFFSPFVRNAETYRQPNVRAAYEAAIAADQKLIEGTMQPGDVLRPWCDGPQRGIARVGVAVMRGEQMVKAWLTAVLL
jgi:hypothetical protein